MSLRILVVGATGMLGRPVVRRLVREGFTVTGLVRDAGRARPLLPPPCSLIPGDVTDGASLDRAMAGADAVYVNLAAPRSPRRTDVELEGTARIVEAARRAGVPHLLKISFMGVPEASSMWWQVRHKALSERSIVESGIGWTIFRPTWFMESLALFRLGPWLVLPRARPGAIWWIAADDYAAQVAAALRSDRAVGRAYAIQGPEPAGLLEAARRFAAARPPSPLRVREIPHRLVRALASVSADARYVLDLLEVTRATNTVFEAQEAWADLGRPATTIEAFARSCDPE